MVSKNLLSMGLRLLCILKTHWSQTKMPPLPEEIKEAIGINNVKTIAEVPAALSNLMLAETVASYGRRQALADQAMGQGLKGLVELDPTQAVSEAKIINSDLAQKVADLASVVGSIQEILRSIAPAATQSTTSTT